MKIANQKLRSELDISELILTLRMCKGLIGILLSKDQQLLMQLQKINVLEDISNDLVTPRDDQDITKVKTQTNGPKKLDVINLLNSPESQVRENVNYCLNKSLLGLDLKKSKVDKRLFKSLTSNSVLDLQDYLFESKYSNSPLVENDIESSRKS